MQPKHDESHSLQRDGISNHRHLDVCSSICSGADQRKHQSSASLAFVREIHRWPVDSPHKGPIMRKMIQFYDIMCHGSIQSGLGMFQSWLGVMYENHSPRDLGNEKKPGWRVMGFVMLKAHGICISHIMLSPDKKSFIMVDSLKKYVVICGKTSHTYWFRFKWPLYWLISQEISSKYLKIQNHHSLKCVIWITGP